MVSQRGQIRRAFMAAIPHTVPICVGFFFVSLSYGFLMKSLGFSTLYPLFMSALVFAGSAEFVLVDLLLAPYSPLYTFITIFCVNARHLFYGIALLDKYKDLGWKRPYLIFGLCDETFTVNCTCEMPEAVDRGWFYFFVTLLNQLSWVGGAVAGSLIGDFVSINTEGLDFILTALFFTMLLGEWEKKEERRSVMVGVLASIVTLIVFTPEGFVIPAMLLIVLAFALIGRREMA